MGTETGSFSTVAGVERTDVVTGAEDQGVPPEAGAELAAATNNDPGNDER